MRYKIIPIVSVFHIKETYQCYQLIAPAWLWQFYSNLNQANVPHPTDTATIEICLFWFFACLGVQHMKEIKLLKSDSLCLLMLYKRCQGEGSINQTNLEFSISLASNSSCKKNGSLYCKHKSYFSFSFHQLTIQISSVDRHSWGALVQTKDPRRDILFDNIQVQQIISASRFVRVCRRFASTAIRTTR